MIGNVCPAQLAGLIGKTNWTFMIGTTDLSHESAGTVQGRAIYVDGKVVTNSVEHVCKHCGCHYSVEVS